MVLVVVDDDSGDCNGSQNGKHLKGDNLPADN